MVGLLLTALLAAPTAQAQAFTLAPTAGVVGKSGEVGLRPGLRLGYEPVPSAGLEVNADMGMAGEWDGGLALAGRLFFDDPGEGLYLVGRLAVGLSGDASDLAPWTAITGGFGARPSGVWFLEADVGPDFALGGPGWRTTLAVGVVFGGPSGIGQRPGQGNVRHRATRKPGD